MGKLTRAAQIVTKYVSIWVIAGAVVAFYYPVAFKPLAQEIPYLLAMIMLGMGLTMTPGEFKLVLQRPKDIFYGITLRYLIMPVVAWGVAKLLALPPELAAGLILVGCCPSGTASNVMTFIARGDTALSVSVSSLNTLLSPILTPAIFLMLVGAIIPVNTSALFIDIFKIIVLPIIIGVSLRLTAEKYVTYLQPIIPAVSVILIVITIGVVVALNAAKISTVAFIALLAVIMHNLLGLGLGYGASRTLGMSEPKSRAIAFEIGIENSGLAVALALAHLDPIAAIPGAIFSVWHNLSGSILAAYWIKKDLSGPDTGKVDTEVMAS
ncbi:bile acid:sodium symporter family protein [Sporomusa sp.]|uniref:bile acid:sodium symporter family protein n=1 Tax=Sporomusa sp. TaxID=2078658 RepID=UPI002B97781A|nr:bile acid:sodium symporter family protein [Sporomusa sp.]HWR06067.1 bile acid:sodium symporter family protein [Sporomusa sp.]